MRPFLYIKNTKSGAGSKQVTVFLRNFGITTARRCLMDKLLTRFLNYVQFDTQSDPDID